MTKLTIKTASEEDFFQRGRRLARSADRGEKLPDERIVSFEDPADMMKLVTAARLAVFRAVRDRPGSITEISARLQRDRSAVKRDVDALERAGLVTVADKILPGHGRMKEVRVTANRISLQAEVQ
jgi:predicted transcriptional regulator